MTSRSDGSDSAAGTRPPRGSVQYVVIVEEHIERRLAARSPCLYISPPQLRTSALALVRLLLGRPDTELGDGPWRMAIAGGDREIRVLRSSSGGQVTLDV
jgi:hypothetical protein